MRKIINLDECDSTQDILKEQLTLNPNENFLIITKKQYKGRGRRENKWLSYDGGVYLSFNGYPHQEASWSTLEISLLLSQFLEENFNIMTKLKWPNDIYFNGKKTSGILAQSFNQQFLYGVGINLYTEKKFEFGTLDLNDISKLDFSLKLINYIDDRRQFEIKKITNEWMNRCIHLNQVIRIEDVEKIHEGLFLGLGHFGEALVKTKNGIEHIFNGSLKF